MFVRAYRIKVEMSPHSKTDYEADSQFFLKSDPNESGYLLITHQTHRSTSTITFSSSLFAQS